MRALRVKDLLESRKIYEFQRGGDPKSKLSRIGVGSRIVNWKRLISDTDTTAWNLDPIILNKYDLDIIDLLSIPDAKDFVDYILKGLRIPNILPWALYTKEHNLGGLRDLEKRAEEGGGYLNISDLFAIADNKERDENWMKMYIPRTYEYYRDGFYLVALSSLASVGRKSLDYSYNNYSTRFKWKAERVSIKNTPIIEWFEDLLEAEIQNGPTADFRRIRKNNIFLIDDSMIKRYPQIIKLIEKLDLYSNKKHIPLSIKMSEDLIEHAKRSLNNNSPFSPEHSLELIWNLKITKQDAINAKKVDPNWSYEEVRENIINAIEILLSGASSYQREKITEHPKTIIPNLSKEELQRLFPELIPSDSEAISQLEGNERDRSYRKAEEMIKSAGYDITTSDRQRKNGTIQFSIHDIEYETKSFGKTYNQVGSIDYILNPSGYLRVKLPWSDRTQVILQDPYLSYEEMAKIAIEKADKRLQKLGRK